MKEELDIPIYREFNDYYQAANTPMRSCDENFHVFRFSELGDEIVPFMGPFSITYFQIAIGRDLKAAVGVFDIREEIEKYTMVIYLPGQILNWEKTGDWDGFVVNFKESFLNLGSIPQPMQSFGFLHSVQPLVVPLSKKEYKRLSYFFELMLQEQEQLQEENIMVFRNLLQVMIVYINRIISEIKSEGRFVELQYQKIATNFKRLVLKHYLQDRSVAFYAGLLEISPAYLADAVKKVFQTTPKCIIDEITFLHAKTLLSSTDIGIKELAWKLKFDDYSHLVKFFKKMCGSSPAAYRKSLKKE
ncbi:MAG: helix-turn-helix domain-containing protein [Mongoliitalea sp.]